MCKKELKEPGAILLAPPEKFEYDMKNEEPFYAGMVQKYHICVTCFKKVMDFISSEEIESPSSFKVGGFIDENDFPKVKEWQIY